MNLIYMQEQPYIGVLVKRCSENVKQRDRRTLMAKCHFNEFEIVTVFIGVHKNT